MNDSETLHTLLDTRSPDKTLFSCCTYVHELYVALENVLKHWIYVYDFICVHMYLWMCVSVYVCVRVHIYVYLCTSTFIYTCVPTLHTREHYSQIRARVSIYARANRNIGMTLTAYLISRLLFLLQVLISFRVYVCVCYMFVYDKAAFHGCPIECLSLSLSL